MNLAELEVRPTLDQILREEADFANQDYAPHIDRLDMSASMFRKYTSPADLWDWRQLSSLLLGEIAGKDILDYGCGMGEESIYLAKLGARVTGIDISETGVECLKRRAAFNGVNLRAYEMRVDQTSFSSESFDRVHGLGILHHVGIEAGLAEVHRLLRPGGVGVFLEPLGDCRVIERAKTWLMTHARFLWSFDHVTDHEHNLTWSEIEAAVRGFSDATFYPYHLGYRLKRFLPTVTVNAVLRLDHAVLTLAPALRHFAGATVIRVRK